MLHHMALGDLEREVMTQLWDAGEPLTVRQVHERVRRDLAYTPVMTVPDRLAKKGVVLQEKVDRAYRYAPAQTREQMTAGLMLDALKSSDYQDAALAYFVGQLPPEALAAALVIVVRLLVSLAGVSLRSRARRARHRTLVDLLDRAERRRELDLA